MAIKVVFSTGIPVATSQSLFQWDYGQTLEIESADIGSEIVEVHFACPSMSEAIVRSCSFSNGVGTVTIPDVCLEQSSTITAWVYRIVGTQGYTWKTIHLPVTARTRPSVSRDVPQEFTDKYTELISEFNEAVNALESGDISAAKADLATEANYASSAGNAATANHANSADSSTNAENTRTVQCIDRIDSIPFSADSGSASIKTTVQLPNGYFPLCITGCSVVLTMGTNASYEISDSGTTDVGCPRVVISAVGMNQGTTIEGGTTYTAAGSVTLTGLFLRYSTNQ